MKIESVAISQLVPAPYNPRRHPDNAIKKLIRSIEVYGFTNPILVQEGTNIIVAGHARLKAAKGLGIEEVPVIYLNLDDAKAKAYTVADNRLQQESEWEFSVLADLLLELDGIGVDLPATGFDTDEIEDLMTWTPDEKKEKGERKITCPECNYEWAA